MSSTLPFTQQTNPMDANGVVRCKHGEQAVKKLSKTSNNPNREFYICARINQSERCGFFYWADDPIFHQGAPPPSILSPSQRQGAAMAPGLETPQKSPNKRLAEIEAALQEPSMSQHSNLQQDVAFTDGRTHSFLFGSSTQSSETSTEVDLEDMLPDVSRIEPSGSPTTLSHPGPGSLDLRTPKKRRLSAEPSSNVKAPQNLPMTPPQTVHRRTGTSSSQGPLRTDFPSTPTRHKGKERENPGLEQYSEDEAAGPMAGAVVPGSSDSSSNVRRASPNPFDDDNTIAEHISSHLEALSVLQAAPYIRKLERKYNALNQSNTIKAKYIEDLTATKAELENEIAQLRRQNTNLQTRLQRFEPSKYHSNQSPSSSTNVRL